MASHRNNEERRSLKALKLLGDRAVALEIEHDEIDSDLQAIKARVKAVRGSETTSESFAESKLAHLERMSVGTPLAESDVDELYREAETAFPGGITAGDLLSATDRTTVDARIARYVDDFNARFGLDRWDYAIAGSCGLMGAMFDLLCVAAPPKPTTEWSKRVDGIFNSGCAARIQHAAAPGGERRARRREQDRERRRKHDRSTRGSSARHAEPHKPPVAGLIPRSCPGFSVRGPGHDARHMYGGRGRRDQDMERYGRSDRDERVRVAGTHVRTLGLRRERAVCDGQQGNGVARTLYGDLAHGAAPSLPGVPTSASRWSTCTSRATTFGSSSPRASRR